MYREYEHLIITRERLTQLQRTFHNIDRYFHILDNARDHYLVIDPDVYDHGLRFYFFHITGNWANTISKWQFSLVESRSQTRLAWEDQLQGMAFVPSYYEPKQNTYVVKWKDDTVHLYLYAIVSLDRLQNIVHCVDEDTMKSALVTHLCDVWNGHLFFPSNPCSLSQ